MRITTEKYAITSVLRKRCCRISYILSETSERENMNTKEKKRCHGEIDGSEKVGMQKLRKAGKVAKVGTEQKQQR